MGFRDVSKTSTFSVDTDLDRTEVSQVQSYRASSDGEYSPRRGDVRSDRRCRCVIRVITLKVVPGAVNSDVS